MYMFTNQEKPISQLGLFEKPKFLVVDANHIWNFNEIKI
jgi:hypothetical protein